MTSILQIAYVPSLLQTRQMMLEKKGYKVVSALGNNQGIALASSADFDAVVIGFSERSWIRNDMVRWLKQHKPEVPVIVLMVNEHESFPEADYATFSEDPAMWLTAVADCVKKP